MPVRVKLMAPAASPPLKQLPRVITVILVVALVEDDTTHEVVGKDAAERVRVPRVTSPGRVMAMLPVDGMGSSRVTEVT